MDELQGICQEILQPGTSRQIVAVRRAAAYVRTREHAEQLVMALSEAFRVCSHGLLGPLCEVFEDVVPYLAQVPGDAIGRVTAALESNDVESRVAGYRVLQQLIPLAASSDDVPFPRILRGVEVREPSEVAAALATLDTILASHAAYADVVYAAVARLLDDASRPLPDSVAVGVVRLMRWMGDGDCCSQAAALCEAQILLRPRPRIQAAAMASLAELAPRQPSRMRYDVTFLCGAAAVLSDPMAARSALRQLCRLADHALLRAAFFSPAHPMAMAQWLECGPDAPERPLLQVLEPLILRTRRHSRLHRLVVQLFSTLADPQYREWASAASQTAFPALLTSVCNTHSPLKPSLESACLRLLERLCPSLPAGAPSHIVSALWPIALDHAPFRRTILVVARLSPPAQRLCLQLLKADEADAPPPPSWALPLFPGTPLHTVSPSSSVPCTEAPRFVAHLLRSASPSSTRSLTSYLEALQRAAAVDPALRWPLYLCAVRLCRRAYHRQAAPLFRSLAALPLQPPYGLWLEFLAAFVAAEAQLQPGLHAPALELVDSARFQSAYGSLRRDLVEKTHLLDEILAGSDATSSLLWLLDELFVARQRLERVRESTAFREADLGAAFRRLSLSYDALERVANAALKDPMPSWLADRVLSLQPADEDAREELALGGIRVRHELLRAVLRRSVRLCAPLPRRFFAALPLGTVTAELLPRRVGVGADVPLVLTARVHGADAELRRKLRANPRVRIEWAVEDGGGACGEHWDRLRDACRLSAVLRLPFMREGEVPVRLRLSFFAQTRDPWLPVLAIAPSDRILFSVSPLPPQPTPSNVSLPRDLFL